MVDNATLLVSQVSKSFFFCFLDTEPTASTRNNAPCFPAYHAAFNPRRIRGISRGRRDRHRRQRQWLRRTRTPRTARSPRRRWRCWRWRFLWRRQCPRHLRWRRSASPWWCGQSYDGLEGALCLRCLSGQERNPRGRSRPNRWKTVQQTGARRAMCDDGHSLQQHPQHSAGPLRVGHGRI